MYPTFVVCLLPLGQVTSELDHFHWKRYSEISRRDGLDDSRLFFFLRMIRNGSRITFCPPKTIQIFTAWLHWLRDSLDRWLSGCGRVQHSNSVVRWNIYSTPMRPPNVWGVGDICHARHPDVYTDTLAGPNIFWPVIMLAPTNMLAPAWRQYILLTWYAFTQWLQYILMREYVCNPPVPLYIGRATRVQSEGTNIYYGGNTSQSSNIID